MKKNNSLDNKIIKKQFIKLVIANMIAFILVYAILGVTISVVVRHYFYSDLEDELRICKAENQYTIAKVQGEYRLKVDNARIKIVLFDGKHQRLAYSKDLLNYIIPDYGFETTVNSEAIASYIDNTEICKLGEFVDDEISFEKTKLGKTEYNFITLTFDVESNFASEVKYCKLLIMNNGEIGIKNNIIRIYLIVSACLVLLGMIASIILSRRTIKPISENMYKQMEFVSDASHELRTPLSIVQSKLENILTKTDASVYDVSEDIAISLKEVARLNRLTNDLLALTRSDNGVATINFDNYDIKEIVKDTIQIFKEMSEIEGRKFESHMETVNFNFDREKIVQLLIILLDNALKYTFKKDLISVSIYKEGYDCCIVVGDTGIGISDEAKKKVFERFYREDKARSRKKGGNGLGLAIAKNIVIQHNGKISVYDNKPKGTIFEVRLPIKKLNKK